LEPGKLSLDTLSSSFLTVGLVHLGLLHLGHEDFVGTTRLARTVILGFTLEFSSNGTVDETGKDMTVTKNVLHSGIRERVQMVCFENGVEAA